MSMGILEGLDDDEIRDKISSNYLPILLVNWQVRGVDGKAWSDPLTRSAVSV
jgi:hypothetical protein